MKNLIKILSLLLIMSAVTFIACNKENVLVEKKNSKLQLRLENHNELMNTEDIIEYFVNYGISNKNPVDFKKIKNPKLIHSISMFTDSTFILRFNPTNNLNLGSDIMNIDFNNGIWDELLQDILNILNQYDNENIVYTETQNLKTPNIFFKTNSYDAIKELILLEGVVSIEPSVELFLLNYDGGKAITKLAEVFDWFANRLSCGCEESPINPNDNINVIFPNVVVPWNYDWANISDGGTWSITSGADIGVAIIDTGVDKDQENLQGNGDFNSGSSFGRYDEHREFLPTNIVGVPNPIGFVPPYFIKEIYFGYQNKGNDRCGHGTKMAGIVAAPRGSDGNSVGIAYNCNLYNFRAVHNPIILTNWEKNAIHDALITVAVDANIHIASMSLGQPPEFSNSMLIEDAINWCDANDKLLVCAAGTASTPLNQVIFPANHPSTIAVTGIKEYYGNFENCNNCFYGDEVDFAVIMQRDDNVNERFTLTLNCEGDDPVYISGSSSSAASLSGYAALVWSRLNDISGTTVSRSDVIQKLIDNSYDPSGNIQDFGHGFINVYDAVY